MEWLKARLDAQRENGLLRELEVQSSGIDFISNDYLGLARSSDSLVSGTVHSGSGGSRLMSGNTRIAEATEAWIAEQFGADAALCFPSGYLANLGLLSAIARKNDTILYDALVHASIRDGIRLSGAHAYRFEHNNVASLLEKKAHCSGNVFVVVESLYSMDGDEAPLEALLDCCAREGWGLIVDEAHSLGIRGVQGKGMLNGNASSALLARVLTFGKAAGDHGAAVLGSETLRSYLINFCRPFIYSTGMPDLNYVLLKKQLERLIAADGERAALWTNVNLFRDLRNRQGQLSAAGPIQQIRVSGNEAVMAMAAAMREEGFSVKGVRSPTVASGSERIRVILHSFNSPNEIERLLEFCRRMGI